MGKMCKSLMVAALLLAFGANAGAQNLLRRSAGNSQLIEITELGYTFGMGNFSNAGRLAIYESAVMPIFPAFGLGMGIGINYYVDANLNNMPLFGLMRVTFVQDFVGVYTDCKVGYALGDIKGFYLSPTLGVRFGRTNAVTLSAGYEMQQFSETDNFGSARRYTVNGLTLRMGFEF